MHQPSGSKGERGNKQIVADTREIHVRHNQQVKIAKRRQLVDVGSRLSRATSENPIEKALQNSHLARHRGSVAQMLDAPDDGNDDGRTANDVNEAKHVLPSAPVANARDRFFNHNQSNVVQHLQRDHNLEHRLPEGRAVRNEKETALSQKKTPCRCLSEKAGRRNCQREQATRNEHSP